mmetsp:Transcript_33799/g.66927  ORF Transcript_33799/g.66927 Transcript_33799/m.66927 type:complete len:275 (-) Transcript_33799:146-970(-)
MQTGQTERHPDETRSQHATQNQSSQVKIARHAQLQGQREGELHCEPQGLPDLHVGHRSEALLLILCLEEILQHRHLLGLVCGVAESEESHQSKKSNELPSLWFPHLFPRAARIFPPKVFRKSDQTEREKRYNLNHRCEQQHRESTGTVLEDKEPIKPRGGGVGGIERRSHCTHPLVSEGSRDEHSDVSSEETQHPPVHKQERNQHGHALVLSKEQEGLFGGQSHRHVVHRDAELVDVLPDARKEKQREGRNASVDAEKLQLPLIRIRCVTLLLT